MGSLLDRLTEKGVVTPPSYLKNAVQYETIMGSVAYGVSGDASDTDVYGFAVPPKRVLFPHLQGEIPGFGTPAPRFEQFQQHHIPDPDGRKGEDGETRTYDVSIFSIVKFFQLCMENNPNMVDSLFTPQRCVLHVTRVGQMVRDHRKIFLHKGSFHKFRGYAYSQLHKADTKTPKEGSKRAEDVEKHGWDCYDEEQTEFLTRRGWLRYDDVRDNDLLACVDPTTGEIVCHPFEDRISRNFTGRLYTIEPYLTRCVVTEGHNLLVSPVARSLKNGYSTEYVRERADWQLRPVGQLATKTGGRQRSFWHIRRAGASTTPDFNISDEYLWLAGLYVSEGSTDFHPNRRVKSVRFSQTERGKNALFERVELLKSAFPLREYSHGKETVWVLSGKTALQLYHDFGHRSEFKHLPDWCLQLSSRQVEILWNALCLGDGTEAVNGEVYYTTSKQLADDLQAMMTMAGVITTVRGPYHVNATYGSCSIYQVFRSRTAKSEHYVNFGRIKDSNVPKTEQKQRTAIKVEDVVDRRVVCFQVPTGVLITRSKGKVAIQGNCKFGYHVVRLLDECEQILTTGDLDLERSREVLKAIRRGEWTFEQTKDYFQRRERELEEVYAQSTLPHRPDEAKIRELLLNCLEEYYGTVADAVVTEDAAVRALRQIREILDRADVRQAG
jgi:hypothetical protein